jgi:hypothetical protein
MQVGYILLQRGVGVNLMSQIKVRAELVLGVITSCVNENM